MPAESVSLLEIDVGSGDLDVVGSESAAAIEVTVRLRTNRIVTGDDDGAIDGMRVSLDAQESAAKLEVDLSAVPDGYHADVIVTLPARLQVVARDDSGDTSISNVAGLSLVDTSGEIEVSDVAGDVGIVDDSGTIDVRRVGGDVDIQDGSGDITVRAVRGVVRIADGSGDISAADVGDLEVVEDSSGSVQRE